MLTEWFLILSLLCRQCRKRTHCYTGGIFWDKSDAKYTSYSFELKLRAVTMYFNEQLGYRKVAKRMGIKDPKKGTHLGKELSTVWGRRTKRT
jgi:hypothetical protein